MTRLRTHDIHLSDGPLHLRPMTEDDWDTLLPWNNDPEVLYYIEVFSTGGEDMDIPIYQVDAFTRQPFRGNPARRHANG